MARLEVAPAGGPTETHAQGTVRPREEQDEPESPGLPTRRRTAGMEQLAEQWENADQREERKRKAEVQLESMSIRAAWTVDTYPYLGRGRGVLVSRRVQR